jgi:hypothetical protein
MNTVKFNEETVDQRRDIIKSMLSEGVYKITFTKVNGETREMPCTLNADMLPSQTVTEDKEKTERKINTENLSVWCTDKNGWRSFKLANVVEIAPLN